MHGAFEHNYLHFCMLPKEEAFIILPRNAQNLPQNPQLVAHPLGFRYQELRALVRPLPASHRLLQSRE